MFWSRDPPGYIKTISDHFACSKPWSVEIHLENKRYLKHQSVKPNVILMFFHNFSDF